MNTIHVWKRVSMSIDFWVKRKFQDKSIHHTSWTLIVGCWSHYSLLKEKTTDYQDYVGGVKVKIPFDVPMRGIYSQGWNWPLWLFNFPHDCSTYMTLRFKSLFNFIHGSLGLPHYITLIVQVWQKIVMWSRRLMTQLDMTLMVCTCWLWCLCRATLLLSDECSRGVP